MCKPGSSPVFSRLRRRPFLSCLRRRDDARCLLVIIGTPPQGKKELVGLVDGVRESALSWKDLLLDLRRRGLEIAPELAVADGALGFWKAVEEVWPKTRGQRCRVHKTANVLNKLPKSQHSRAKRAPHEIWMAETRADAEAAFDAFIETYGLKYEKAAEKSRRRLDGHNQLPKIIQGVKFFDGIKAVRQQSQAAA